MTVCDAKIIYHASPAGTNLQCSSAARGGRRGNIQQRTTLYMRHEILTVQGRGKACHRLMLCLALPASHWPPQASLFEQCNWLLIVTLQVLRVPKRDQAALFVLVKAGELCARS